MKKQLRRAFLLILLLSTSDFFPQKGDVAFHDVAKDDLGMVTDEFQEYFFEALKQKAIENPEKAIQALLKCLEIDPKPVVYFELGKNYNSLKKYDQAASYLIKARKAVPKNEAVMAALYNTYFLSEQFDMALPVVEKLQKTDPSYDEDLAHLYIVNQKYDEALQLLDSLDKKQGESEYRNSLRRQIYSQTNNVTAKIEELKNRIAKNPNEEQNYLNLIFVYSEDGQSYKAFETAKKLLKINPDSQLVHLALYKFYLNEHSFDQALKSMQIVLETDAIDEKIKYKVIHDLLLSVKENPALQPNLIKMVDLFSKTENSTNVYGELATYFLKNNQKKHALQYFEKALGEETEDFNLIKSTLLLQIKFKKFEAAKQLSEKAIESYPSQSFLYLINGSALNQMELYKDAEESLSFGLDFLIDNPKMKSNFYHQLSIANTGLGNKEKASEFQKKAIKLKKDKP